MSRLIPILMFAALASACSSTDSPGDTNSGERTPASSAEGDEQAGLADEPQAADEEVAVRDAVATYVSAFGEGTPDAAWALVSERCRDLIQESEYRAAVAAAGELYPDLTVDEFSDIVLDGDTAVAFYSTNPVVEEGDGERWTRDAGTWRWDDC